MNKIVFSAFCLACLCGSALAVTPPHVGTIYDKLSVGGPGQLSMRASGAALGSDDTLYVVGTSADALPELNFCLWSVGNENDYNNDFYSSAGGISGDFQGIAVNIDNSGNPIVAGSELSPSTWFDIAVGKYHPGSLSQIWGAAYDSSTGRRDEAHAVASDGSGDTYVLGTTYNGILPAVDLLKYDPNGQLLWAHIFIPANGVDATPSALAVDSAGNAFVAGSVVVAGNNQSFVRKYNPNGSIGYTFTHVFATATYEFGRALNLDASDNAYVVGTTFINTLPYLTAYKVNPAGTLAWDADYETQEVLPTSSIIDSAGNLYAYGEVPNGLNNYAALLKWSKAGAFQWEKNYAPGGNTNPSSLTLDSYQCVYISGATTAFGGGVFVARVLPSGTIGWDNVHSLGSVAGYDPQTIAIDPHGDIFLAGYLSHTNAPNTAFATHLTQNAIAENDQYSTPENQYISSGGVLGNDYFYQSSTPGLPPTQVVLSQNVSHGTLTLYGDGSFYYKPDTNFVGTDMFTYYIRKPVSGGYMTSNIASVAIKVG